MKLNFRMKTFFQFFLNKQQINKTNYINSIVYNAEICT